MFYHVNIISYNLKFTNESSSNLTMMPFLYKVWHLIILCFFRNYKNYIFVRYKYINKIDKSIVKTDTKIKN